MEPDAIDNLLAQTPLAPSVDRSFVLRSFDEPSLKAPPAEDLSSIQVSAQDMHSANLERRHGVILQRASHLSAQLSSGSGRQGPLANPPTAGLSPEAAFLLERFQRDQQVQRTQQEAQSAAHRAAQQALQAPKLVQHSAPMDRTPRQQESTSQGFIASQHTVAAQEPASVIETSVSTQYNQQRSALQQEVSGVKSSMPAESVVPQQAASTPVIAPAQAVATLPTTSAVPTTHQVQAAASVPAPVAAPARPASPAGSDSSLSSAQSVTSEMLRIPTRSFPTLKRTAEQAELYGTISPKINANQIYRPVEQSNSAANILHRYSLDDNGQPVTPSKQKKRVNDQAEQQTTDPRYLEDAKTRNAQIVEDTQSYLDEIFEAEDDLEADTSENSGKIRSTFFDTLDKRLTSTTTSHLLNVLRRASNASQLACIDSDALARLLRILSRAIESPDVNRLRILEEEPSDESERQWLRLVDAAYNAMLSSLCVLNMLQSTQKNKQLYSEETLLGMIDAARSVFEDLFSRWFKAPVAKLGPAAKHKTMLTQLLSTTVQFLQHASRVLSVLDADENVLSRIEFMAIATIFSESPPKDHPTCSVSTVEALKLNSMAILQTIFVHYTSQRRFILDEVLTNLNKLSTARQGARQYRLRDGRSIQLTSALLLHLVQASAMIAPEQEEVFKLQRTPSKVKQEGEETGELDDSETSGLTPALYAYIDKTRAATMTANFIVTFLLNKTMKSHKAINAEDAPLRALLDSFVEDFLAVLALPEWPAAEILLRLVTRRMIAMVDDPKSGSQIKSFALDTLCAIAKRIRELSMSLQAPLPEKHSELEADLFALPKYELTASTTRAQLDQLASTEQELLAHLAVVSREDVNFSSAVELSLACFVASLAGTLGRSQDQRLKDDLTLVAIALDEAHASEDVAVWQSARSDGLPTHIRTRACVSLLTFYGLMHMFDAILPRMLSVMDHSQPTLRTKALRSLGSLSSTDPTVLSLKIVQAQVNLRLSDVSPQVRDAALDLLGKYIIANASLGKAYFGVLSDRLCDTGIAVRKRVIKLLRDVYANNEDVDLRASIAQRYLLRLRDEEDSVRDLIIKVLTDLWFAWPELEFSERSNDFDALPIKLRQRVKNVAEVISLLAGAEQEATVELLRELLSIYSEVEQKSLRHQPKYLLSLLTQAMLAEATQGTETRPRLQHLLALKILVYAVPTILTVSQVESLKPFLLFGANEFERYAAGHVASIYTKVIPRQASYSDAFLAEVQGMLLEQLTKLPTKVLNQAVPCLCEVVKMRSDYRRIIATIKSCLTKLVNLNGQVEPKTTKAAVLLLSLLGLFGRHLVITDKDMLQKAFPKIASQEGFVQIMLQAVTEFCPHEKLATPSESQKAGVRALANICISYPNHFQDIAVLAVMDQIMQGSSLELKRLLIGVFQEFLANESSKAELQKLKSPRGSKKAQAADIDVEVLIGTTQKFATDGVSPGLMQRYMKDMLKAASGSDQTLASLALDVLGKIVMQGLSNPRDCVPTVIALETSSNSQLRDLALQIHTAINEKHESLIDSCYLDGVKAAFHYQTVADKRDTSADTDSLLEPMYGIVRSSRQARKKLLMAITRGLDVNLDKLTSLDEEDVQYAAFVANQVARLKYATSEEVHFLIFGLDRIASSTTVAFMQLIDRESEQDSQPLEITPEHSRAAAILALGLSLRTYLRLAYNMSDAKCRTFNPQKLGSKADIKTAVRQAGVSLSPDWSSMLDPNTDRLALLKSLFGQVERQIESEDEADRLDTNMTQQQDEARLDDAGVSVPADFQVGSTSSSHHAGLVHATSDDNARLARNDIAG